jgi:hypothetical protein
VAERDASEPEEEEWENGIVKAVAEAIRREAFPDANEGEERTGDRVTIRCARANRGPLRATWMPGTKED